MALEIHGDKMVAFVVVSATATDVFKIGSSTNFIAGFELERTFACASTNNN